MEFSYNYSKSIQQFIGTTQKCFILITFNIIYNNKFELSTATDDLTQLSIVVKSPSILEPINFFKKMNNPAAEQRGISKCIERPKGRGITPGEIKYS